MSTAIGADHGHWSDTLRKCHDHERLAFNRRTNHEYRECDESYLSVLLSGTPAQVKPLIPSAENGLFSRQLFYFMPPIDEWMDQFDSEGEDYGLRFATWGTQWKQVLDLINGSVQTIQLRLSEKQKELFNQRFAQLFSHAGYAYGGSMRSAVARIAINTCRILSIVALLRALRNSSSPTKNFQFSIFHFQFPRSLPRPGDPHREYQGWYRPVDLRVTDEDFQAVLTLIEPLYRHSSYVLGFLPTSEAVPVQTSPEQALFNALPMMFCRRQAVEEAAKNGIPEKTLDSSLKRMLEKGTLIKTARGEYAFSSHVCVRERRQRNEGMKEMPLLSSPVSTTVAALRQYWRCLMPVPASPLAYTDGWRYLLSRTTQVTEDQPTCREVKTRCPGGSPYHQAPGQTQ